MPLNSVCQYLKTQLNGLAIPNQTKTLEAFVQPPLVEAPSGPKAYIWGSTGSWKRQSMPRVQGFQEFLWPIDIWLTLTTSSRVANIDQVQPLFLDAVLTTLLHLTMPVFITDPTTSLQTQLWQIAESGKITNPPGREAESVRLLVYGTGIAVTVKELIQA